MHTSWLLPTALLSTSVSAFYPYHHSRKPSDDDGNAKRFSPITSSGGMEEPGVITLDIRKGPSPIKRENKFPVVVASQPNAPNAAGIDEDGQDFSYFSTVKFGSKAQDLYMLIDTGSANTWVMSDRCPSPACQAHTTFGPSESTTLNVTNNAWSLTYGTGNVAGVVASDTVAFANYSLQLGFGLATTASNDFNSYPMDGILGLGCPAADELGSPTLMSVMASQKLLAQNVVGVHLQRASDSAKDGQITFGGVDSSKFTGSLGYTNVVAGSSSWELPVGDTLVNGISCNFTGKTAMVDTGTSYILMPPTDAATFHGLINGSTASGQSFNIPCNAAEVVQFSFSGIAYGVSPKDYIGKPISGSTTLCSSNVVGHQAFGPNQWILGDVFLKNVYSVFDYDNNRIGFGAMNGKATPPPSVDGSAGATSSGTSLLSTNTSPATSGMAGRPSTQALPHSALVSSASGNLPSETGASSTMSTITSKPSGTAATTSSSTAPKHSATAATNTNNGSPLSNTNLASRSLTSIGSVLLATLLAGLLI